MKPHSETARKSGRTAAREYPGEGSMAKERTKTPRSRSREKPREIEPVAEPRALVEEAVPDTPKAAVETAAPPAPPAPPAAEGAEEPRPENEAATNARYEAVK